MRAGVAFESLSGDNGRAMPESETPPPPPPSNNGLMCPVCADTVDPRRTTQAISRNGRLLLFCSSGCLRQFVAAENAAKNQ